MMLVLHGVGTGQGTEPSGGSSDTWTELEGLWEKGDTESRVRYLELCARHDSRRAIRRMLGTHVLEDKREPVRAAVVRCLSEIKEPQAVEYLKEQLQFPNPEIREIVAGALGVIPKPGGLEALVEGLEKEVIPSVKAAFARALGAYPDQRSVEALLKVATPPRPRAVREAALSSLGQIPLPEAVRALLSCANEPDWTLRETLEHGLSGRAAAQAGLEQCLKEGLSSERPRQREVAAIAAGKIGLTGLEGYVAKLSADPDVDCAVGAAIALGRFSESATAGGSLLGILEMEPERVKPEVRVAAAYSVGEAGVKSEPARLVKLIATEKDWRVREALKLVLARLILADGQSTGTPAALFAAIESVEKNGMAGQDLQDVLDCALAGNLKGLPEETTELLEALRAKGRLPNDGVPAGRAAYPPILAKRPQWPRTVVQIDPGDSRRGQANAVSEGLLWLMRNQEADGRWGCAKHNPYSGNVPLVGFDYEDEVSDPAVTGLALLTLMAEGYVPASGPHREAMRRAIDYILSCQDETGLINIEKGHVHNARCLPLGSDHGSRPRRYNHNICTLALVEAYAMTGVEKYKIAAVRALDCSRNTPMPG
ncbi:MAG: HEAT repeat domain-containing protein, partial [Planctomycetota bacterium]|nr:HEAT repeat domain-containing protein [Planctomycetota bacterium]